MHPKTFASVGGFLLLIVGLLALLPSLTGAMNNLPPLNVETSYGMFLGLVPMNLLNKLAMIILGAAGIAASRSAGRELPRSIAYCRMLFAVSGTLAILGLIPATNTIFGYWPVFGLNSPISGVISLIAGYFGFMLTSKVRADRTGTHPTRESLA